MNAFLGILLLGVWVFLVFVADWLLPDGEPRRFFIVLGAAAVLGATLQWLHKQPGAVTEGRGHTSESAFIGMLICVAFAGALGRIEDPAHGTSPLFILPFWLGSKIGHLGFLLGAVATLFLGGLLFLIAWELGVQLMARIQRMLRRPGSP